MRRLRRLLVIDPSVAYPEDEGVAQVLSGWPAASLVLQPALKPGDGPGPGFGYGFDAVVVLGSRASVHDDLPWLEALGAWLDPVLRGRELLPVLGICFGHQLIAHRAGGEVGLIRPDGAKEVGLRETVLDGSRLLPGRRGLRVVVSHREEVKKAPPGYRVVAKRQGVDVDGMEHETLPIFGFQFHPEARDEFLSSQGLDPSCMDDAMRADCQRLLAAFLEGDVFQSGVLGTASIKRRYREPPREEARSTASRARSWPWDSPGRPGS